MRTSSAWTKKSKSKDDIVQGSKCDASRSETRKMADERRSAKSTRSGKRHSPIRELSAAKIDVLDAMRDTQLCAAE